MGNELAASRGLAPLIGHGPGLYLALGPAVLPAWFLTRLCPALAGGARVFWVDATNSFAAYAAGRAARSLGIPPRTVLDRIRLSRPFNSHQLTTLLTRTLPPLWRGEPVVVSDPFPMLFDEEVPQREARRALDAILNAVAALPGVWLLLAVHREAPRGREGWLAELAGRARRVAVLNPRGPDWRLEREPA
ncbi:MAG: hypothetical protein A2X36_00640 [Elusimicrobia bacterium GWA2_69_24]|nr:MAG: hypothetical protein A2X36_00640 [Elusimicrobia bacterium GWA2_69_24]